MSRRGLSPFLLLLTLGCGGSGDSATTPECTTPGGCGGSASGAPLKWVAPFHPSYQWDEVRASQVPWGQITHLILGYLWPASGPQGPTLGPPDSWDEGIDAWRSRARAYADAGHAASRKVLLMIGGEGSNSNREWNQATSSVNATSFARNIRDFSKGVGFDGVNLNWEEEVDYTGYIRISQELRKQWPEAIITIPTSFVGDDASDLAPAQASVDAFMPMTYIPISQWGGWLIPVPLTPLYAAQKPGNDPNPYSVDLARKRWQQAGVPASKLVIGVGGFGAAWTDTQSDGIAPVAPYSNASLSGAADTETDPSYSDNAITWSWLKRTLAAHPELDEGWDDVGKCSYWHAPARNQLVGVEGPWGGTERLGVVFYESNRSMDAKVAYVRNLGLGGLMFWTLSQMMDGASSPILDEANR